MENNRLANLLNNESFLRWLREDASREEQDKWEKWMSSNPERKILVEKAKKIITLPFREWDDSTAKSQELQELMSSLEDTTNLRLLKDNE